MKRTQVQIPEPLYREVKRVAELKDWSISEVFRRAAEDLVAQFPPAKKPGKWELPEPRNVGLPLAPADQWRDLLADDQARTDGKAWMKSFDTNIIIYAINSAMPEHEQARRMQEQAELRALCIENGEDAEKFLTSNFGQYILGQAELIVSPAQFEGLTKVLEEQEKFQKIKDTPLYKKLEGLE